MSPEHLYYIAHCFNRQANAGSKPSTDVEDVVASMGAHRIGLPRWFSKSNKLVHLRDIINTRLSLRQMPRGKVVLLQYPAQHAVESLARQAKRRGNRLIVVVHDINSLRGGSLHDDGATLSLADVIIVHTPAMAAWVSERFPGKEVIILEMFDYLQSYIPAGAPPAEPTVVFAGNLGKSTFLSKLAPGDGWRLVLYGTGAPEELVNRPGVDYRGSCMPEELPQKISNEAYGLVWDGNSTETCSGPMGQYLRYNAPYKLSSYIAAGLPVVVWSQMAIAPYVLAHGLGLTVDSLDSLGKVLPAVTPAKYAAMRGAVASMQAAISSGHHIRSAIEKALVPLSSELGR